MDDQTPRGPLGDLSPPTIDDGTLVVRSTPQRGPADGPVPGRRASMCFASPDFRGALQIDFDTFIEGYEREKPPFGKLTQGTRDNLIRFVRGVGAHASINNVYQVAYILATTLHECRSAATKWVTTWSPVSESKPKNPSGYFTPVIARDYDGWPIGTDGTRVAATLDAKGAPKLGKHKTSGLADTQLGSYFAAGSLLSRAYYGRGYVQITHLDNYRSMDEALGLNGSLIADPERALEHEIAMNIAIYGMVNGSFRGSKKRVVGKGVIGGHKLSDYGGNYVKARAIINAPSDHGETVAGHARIFERLIQDSRLA
jgi:hypothetical protein